jgi:hypothetical protein
MALRGRYLYLFEFPELESVSLTGVIGNLMAKPGDESPVVGFAYSIQQVTAAIATFRQV